MLQNCNVYSILKVFFDEPTKDHYLMEISKKSRLAHTSVKKYLNDLRIKDIVIEKIEKKGKRNFPIYKANLNNKNYTQIKRINNINNLYNSNIINHINEMLMPKVIILFGSYSRGEDIEESDIDIFLECKKQNIDLIKFEKILKRKIQIQYNENFNSYSKELKNNILNGIILSGYLEVFK